MELESNDCKSKMIFQLKTQIDSDEIYTFFAGTVDKSPVFFSLQQIEQHPDDDDL